VGASVHFYGDLHAQLLESEFDAYREAAAHRYGGVGLGLRDYHDESSSSSSSSSGAAADRLLVVVHYNPKPPAPCHTVCVAGTSNAEVPLDELAFGRDWVVVDYTFVDPNGGNGCVLGCVCMCACLRVCAFASACEWCVRVCVCV
jgi:hypothetical protein